jgi:hypothetical protein
MSEWEQSALCRKIADPEVFFAQDWRAIRDAIELCTHCPVAGECAAYVEAIEPAKHRYGVYGGQTAAQRSNPVGPPGS